MDLQGQLVLSDMISIAIIAGLLSLLPVVALLWVYYVRERQPSVSGSSVSRFFALGVASVIVSVLLEKAIYMVWCIISSGTCHLFFPESSFEFSLFSVSISAVIAFAVIALVEEGSRYVFMRFLMKNTPDMDQVIDGVQFGIALGLGFAFLENTLYFLELFKGFEFDTLVIVFFLRFLISTVGHMSFGGFMGYYLARAQFNPADRKSLLRQAFVYPFLMHGLFDFLLSIQLSFYTVLLLVFPIVMFWVWWHDDQLFHVFVLNGKRLKFPVAARPESVPASNKHIVEILPSMHSCPNCYVAIDDVQTKCKSCGVRFHRKIVTRKAHFIPGMNTNL